MLADEPRKHLAHFQDQLDELSSLLGDARAAPGDIQRAERLSDQLFLMQETLDALGVRYALGYQADWHAASGPK